MFILIAIILAYLLGSVPTGYLWGRLSKNIDIREHGSGNMGATNVFRVLGKGPGMAVLLLDILKGLVAVIGLGTVLGVDAILGRVALAVAAVAGHNWTVFLGFKGGKGVATSLGVLLALVWAYPSLRIVLLVTLLSWAGVFFTTRYVSLASIAAAVVLPAAMLATSQPLELTLTGVLFGAFILFRHRSNMERLKAGTENRSNWPRRPGSS